MAQANMDDAFDPTAGDQRCTACRRIPWDPRIWDLLARYNRRNILSAQAASNDLGQVGPFHHRSVCELHLKYRLLEDDAPLARRIRDQFHQHSECQDDLEFARRCMQNDNALGKGDMVEFRKRASSVKDTESGHARGLGSLRQFEVEYLRSLLNDEDNLYTDGRHQNAEHDSTKTPAQTSAWGNQVKYFEETRTTISTGDAGSTSVFRTDPTAGGRMTLYFSHLRTADALIRAAAAGCHLCRTFRTMMHTSWLQADYSGDSCQAKIVLSEDPDEPGSVTFGFSQYREASLPLAKIPSWTTQRLSVSQIQSWSDTGDPDLQHIASQVIHPWIHECDQRKGLHEHCQLGLSTEAKRPLPTRLIDVGEGLRSPVRLVASHSIPSDTPEGIKYCILSYCWGAANENAKTTRANLHERLDEIETRNLPKTIRDAIRLTRAMGIRYLWADALCIIQRHSEDPYLEDFFREAPKMGSYYSNAYCLISALSAVDSSIGLFPDGEVGKYDTKPRLVGYDGSADEAWVVRNTVENVETELRIHTPALERGWCLQERLLSPRVLHWSTVGVFWQCRSMEASEWRPEGKALNTHGTTFLLAQEYDSIVTEPLRSRATGELWTKLVKTYQMMQLGDEVDRLNAIQGLGNKLANIHGDQYFAGIFLSRAANGLLWQGEKRPEFLNGSEDFPTWSWGSARHSTFINPDTSLVRSVSIPSEGPLPVRDTAYLGLRGGREMRNIRLLAPLVDMLDLEITGTGVHRAATWRHRNLKLEIHFDDISLIPEAAEGLQILLLGHMKGMNPLFGIAVRNNEADRRYLERTGFVVVRTSETEGSLEGFLERYMSTVDLI